MTRDKKWNEDGWAMFWLTIVIGIGKAWPDPQKLCVVAIVAVALLAVFRMVDRYYFKSDPDAEASPLDR
jgi:hypothetical protein